MDTVNIALINSLNFLELKNPLSPFNVCWVASSCVQNRDTLSYRFHRHNFYEIHFTLKGYVTYGFREDSFTVKENEFLIIPPLSEHEVSKHNDSFFKLTLALDTSDESLVSLLNVSANKIHKLSHSALTILNSILEISQKKRFFKSEIIHALLCSLIYELLETTPTKQTIQKNPNTDSRVIKAKKFIDDNFDVFFTCDEVAWYCNVSTKQLGRLFKQYENVGLLEYIHQQKLTHAKKLLLDPTLSIKDVSKKLGFSDANYFSKFFLRLTGITPAKYIQNETNQ